ncbi:MAG: bifunctional pyr operon transcriptional regulator/uracil phosphoribosyltransferase PyrR [Firmicutes bacterium HGW-Firmicutes-16]|nr:MAG: bifunctional pyr operon transcriptional regulator/uracil phosphoribosyltransferase PyrR [Firmicutes bacterium HGW-Firmicutes-16]
MKFKAQIMTEEDVNRVLVRISHEILEKNHGSQNLCLIGIRTRGIPLAYRLAQNIKKIDDSEIDVGELDITLYRDDLSLISKNPVVSQTKIPFSVEDKTVVLVDDVIFTGRTARAALEAVMEVGRPAKIQLAVLIDRGHSELPIKATYVGKNIPTSQNEVISVHISEHDGYTDVCIKEK